MPSTRHSIAPGCSRERSSRASSARAPSVFTGSCVSSVQSKREGALYSVHPPFPLRKGVGAGPWRYIGAFPRKCPNVRVALFVALFWTASRLSRSTTLPDLILARPKFCAHSKQITGGWCGLVYWTWYVCRLLCENLCYHRLSLLCSTGRLCLSHSTGLVIWFDRGTLWSAERRTCPVYGVLLFTVSRQWQPHRCFSEAYIHKG
ncbi:hypothetical protein BV25DRAFT_1048649 [Artomyces pyxidatus]|uniref:Uncharacterized protein n=1 Tax=Artomyces pyxidatus TaxID=48021 RepID=A0ACB8SU45_9AGAM|nr:hypothetical protein BV25DRAFT_1048649 [Artomyces pyxidatus]